MFGNAEEHPLAMHCTSAYCTPLLGRGLGFSVGVALVSTGWGKDGHVFCRRLRLYRCGSVGQAEEICQQIRDAFKSANRQNQLRNGVFSSGISL